MYNLQNHALRGSFEAYQKNSSLSSLLETLIIVLRYLPNQNPPVQEAEPPKGQPGNKEEPLDDESDEEEGKEASQNESQKKDEAKDYDKVKEHMHMVLARYAKEGVIDYKEAAQIHDVLAS